MKKIGLLLATLTAFSAQADVFPKTEVDAYLMAMHSMAPVNAKYTIQYKAAVESSCKTKLSIEQLSCKLAVNTLLQKKRKVISLPFLSYSADCKSLMFHGISASKLSGSTASRSKQ